MQLFALLLYTHCIIITIIVMFPILLDRVRICAPERQRTVRSLYNVISQLQHTITSILYVAMQCKCNYVLEDNVLILLHHSSLVLEHSYSPNLYIICMIYIYT